MSSETGGYRSQFNKPNGFGNSSNNNRNYEPRQYHGSKRRQTDEELYEAWAAVYAQIETNPDAFDIWESLIDAAVALEGGLTKSSSERALQLARFSFDLFLKRFPHAHRYWIRFAKLEFRLGFTENAKRMFLEGVSNVPASVELWKEYCGFVLMASPDSNATRVVFESAVAQVGLHFLSHGVWDKYIEFEEREQDPIRLAKLYARIVRIPLHQYARYFAKFLELAPSVPIEEIVPATVIEQFRAEFEVDKAEQEEKPKQTADESRAEEEADLSSRVADYHYQIYVTTQNQVAARWQYEAMIKRSFFHVVYLPEDELVNWRRYLYFEEVEGNEDRIIALYERAVIPTARYEEVWLRYARWLVASDLPEHARTVFQRGAYSVPIGRTELRLQFARFEESQGFPETAKEIYSSIIEALPACVEAIIGLANLKRRHESSSAAIEFLEAKCATLLEDPSNKDFILAAALLVVSLANISLYFRGGIKAARKVYQDKAVYFAQVYHFWLEYLRFEISETSFIKNAKLKREQQEIIAALYDQIKTSAGLTPAQLKDLGHIYMVHLLSSDELNSQQATQKYFQIDLDVHS
ncbi:hypothetical protein D0Z00_001838 [Geotrichum galactomycetum]|uniref:Uncharacterized protein n=1 Tax=Geotrichum galactomycetum TaxID=27317 RepID=A0ACB6V5Z0_9ASCO|nr:hypothetical protein D0Z00_001838 [Geotrichum candidum]